ncbi:MAG TPA: membrane protein insertase YidC [Bacteroidota bacterium]|nr:membrane protein insertase YidC [Bacteroidota bacterium]
MDRKAIAGFILIGLILMVWMWKNAPTPQNSSPEADTLKVQIAVPDTGRKAPSPTVQGDSLGRFFSALPHLPATSVTVETPRYTATLSSRGGAILSWVMKGYATWDHYPVNLIGDRPGGDFNMIFLTADGKLINTRQLDFSLDRPAGSVNSITGTDSLTLTFTLSVDGNSKLVKKLTFHADRYDFDADFQFVGMQQIISNYEYQVVWENGLRYQEANTINESNFAKASAFSGGELTEIDATNFNEQYKQSITGRTAWVATRNKYFAVAIIPRGKESQGAMLEGSREKLPDNGAKENYSLTLKMPFTGSSFESDRFTVFLGPLDFDMVRAYNVELDRIMSLGSVWIIRPISQYVIIPVFKFLRLFISNYGIILLIFALIIKIVLYPLTKSSMTSMRKMQKLQPMMEEIKAKYKDDPQKMNQQVMRLYKEYGVNPAGGCLPLLLQLPILYALWAVFSATIELRQAPFFGWINDLSSPDIIATLPFHIPIFNIDKLSGLAILMGITMFVQQKMSVKDPRQKMMVWLMPVMMTLLFNGFPAGLNLYYFMFNLLSIGQQAWVNKKHEDEPLRKVEEKKNRGGIFAKFAKNMPKLKQ